MPVTYPLHHVIVAEVKKVDTEINRNVINQEESQVSVHSSRVFLTHVEYHNHEKEHTRSRQ